MAVEAVMARGSDPDSPQPQEPPAAAALHPITLQLTAAPQPGQQLSELENRFWVEVGTPAYAETDQWALLASCANLLTSWRGIDAIDKTTQPLVNLLVKVWFVAMIAGSACVLALLRRAPDRYLSLRTPLVVAQRVSRSGCLLVCFGCSGVNVWRSVLSRWGDGADGGGLLAAGILPALVLYASFLVMHALVFSMKLRYAAPLQFATCALGAHACRGLACLVRSDAVLAAAARRLCMAAFSVKGAALLALGPMAIGSDARQVCAKKSMELLIPLFSALPCFASLYVLYERELRYKVRYLKRTGAGEPEPIAPLAVRYILVGPLITLASFVYAEASVAFGKPYQC